MSARRERVRALHAAGKVVRDISILVGVPRQRVASDLAAMRLTPNGEEATQRTIQVPPDGPIGDRILAALRETGEWTSTTIIRRSARHDKRWTLQALERLFRAGLVEKKLETRPGDNRQRAFWRAAKAKPLFRPSVGDRVVIRSVDHPRLDGCEGVVVKVEEWGAHLHTEATATNQYRATWDEMFPS